MDPISLFSRVDRFGPPEFIKEASVSTAKELAELPDESFADPGRRRFPCHTKAACYLAAVEYFPNAVYDSREGLDVAGSLLKFAAYWGIDKEVGSVMSQVADDVDRYQGVIPDSAFLLTTESGGRKLKMFPATDEQNTAKSASDLYDARCRLPFADRTKAASALLLKAKELGLTLSDQVEDWAKRASLSDDLEFVPNQLIAERYPCYLSRNAVVAHEFNGLSDDSWNKQAAQAMFQMVEDLDMETGLYQHYTMGLALPEELGMVPKRAKVEVTLNNGAKLDLEQVAEHLGKAAAILDPECIMALDKDLVGGLAGLSREQADSLLLGLKAVIN